MAKDLKGNEVKAASTTKLLVVKNQNAHPAADPFYIAIRGEFEPEMLDLLRKTIVPNLVNDHEALEKIFPKDGDVTLLFTQEDIVTALVRAAKNEEDIPEPGTIFDWFEELFK
jgi:hypothetical protein